MSEQKTNQQFYIGHRHIDGRALELSVEERRRHLYAIGSTGSGKTNFLQSLILQDIHQGRGVCLLDPHGDMAVTVANAIPRERIADTIYFDVADRAYPIAFNPLADCGDRDQRELVASQIIATFKGLWRESWGEWLEYLLKNTLLAVLERESVGVSLVSIQRMLDDPLYRERVLVGVHDPLVRQFWLRFGEKSQRAQLDEIRSTLNKSGKWGLSLVLRNILGQRRSSFSVSEVMDDGKILIVNLSKGLVGEDNANLLGSLLVSEIYGQAMRRARMPEAERRDFHLYIDEFQNFTTANFASIVSEARKYRLCLALAHQNFTQIDPRVLDAILKNVGSLASFAVNLEDAEKLSTYFSPITPSSLSGNGVGQFWFSQGGRQPHLIDATSPVEQAIFVRKSIRRVQNNCRRTYGRQRRVVENEFARWWGSSQHWI